jgi:ubiquinone/menaquinone biosynthesis C-methylase UbiE
VASGEDTPARSATWRGVWSDRDHDLADWNGYESSFESLDAYEVWIEHVGSSLRDLLSLSPGDVVADLGCGTGRVAAQVAPWVREVHAFDYAEAPIRVASSRRSHPHVTYHVSDLTGVDPVDFAVTKAYAVGSLHYLDSRDVVLGLVQRFVDAGSTFVAFDLVDASMTGSPVRSYDTTVYSHLTFRPEDFTGRFPGARVLRDAYPGYANAPYRFGVVIPARAA